MLIKFWIEVVTVSSWTLDSEFKTYWLIQPRDEAVRKDPQLQRPFHSRSLLFLNYSNWWKFTAPAKTAHSLRTRLKSYLSSNSTLNVSITAAWDTWCYANKQLQNHGASNTRFHFSVTLDVNRELASALLHHSGILSEVPSFWDQPQLRQAGSMTEGREPLAELQSRI